MSAWRTALSGMLGLALLDAVVSSNQAAGRVGGLLSGVGKVVEHILSPTVPAIPDLRTKGGKIGKLVPPLSGGAGGSLLPPDWTTKPNAPATPASASPSQVYV